MAGDWDSAQLVELLEAMARQIDTLIPPNLQSIRRMYEARHPALENNDRRWFAAQHFPSL